MLAKTLQRAIRYYLSNPSLPSDERKRAVRLFRWLNSRNKT